MKTRRYTRIEKANIAIFSKLIHKVYGEASDGKTRFINTKYVKYNEENVDNYIKKAKILDEFLISHHILCAILQFKEEKYFVISGIESELKDDLQQREIYEFGEEEKGEQLVGLIVVILSELQITLNNSYKQEQIEHEILSLYKEENENYIGHSYQDIKKCFSPIKIFDITSSALEIKQLAGVVLCNQNTEHLQPFSEESIAKFIYMFEQDFNDISGEHIDSIHENLVYSLHSISWKHRFLELYRCIENLYPIFAIKELYSSLNIDKSKINIKEFYSAVNNKLNWNGKELDSLNKIVNSIHDIDTHFLSIANGKTTANFLYDIRNSIVHFCIIESDSKKTKIEDISKFDDKKWNTIILGMLEIIDKLYKEYETYRV